MVRGKQLMGLGLEGNLSTIDNPLSDRGMQLTKEFEGFSSRPYKDTVGKKTIGYGFNIDDPVIRDMVPKEVASGKRGITKIEADQVFESIYAKAQDDAISFLGSQEAFDVLDDDMKDNLVDMSYNLGLPRLKTFKKMREGFLKKDRNKIAEEMKNSKWFKQTGRRGRHHVETTQGKRDMFDLSALNPFGAKEAEASEIPETHGLGLVGNLDELGPKKLGLQGSFAPDEPRNDLSTVQKALTSKFGEKVVGVVKSIDEVNKGIGRGVAGIERGINDIANWLAQNLSDLSLEGAPGIETDEGVIEAARQRGASDKEIKKIESSLGARKNFGEFLNKVGAKMETFTASNSDFWKDLAQKGQFAPDPKLFRGTFMQNPSFTRAAALVSEAIPSLGAAATVTVVTRSPTMGGFMLGSLEGSGQFQEAREAGASLEKANVIGTVSTIGIGVSEMIPFNVFLNAKARKGILGIARGAAEQGLVEATQEGTQSIFTNLVAKIGYDRSRSLYEGLIESIIAGAGSGGLMGSFRANVAPEIDENINAAIEDGVTSEEIDQGTAEVAGVITQNAEEIDTIITNEVLDDPKIAKDSEGKPIKIEAKVGEDAPESTISPENEPVVIPEFKSTEEALRFGVENKDNPEVLEALKVNREEIRAKSKELTEKKDATPEDEAEAFRLAQIAQFPREALEAAEGKIDQAQVDRALEKVKEIEPDVIKEGDPNKDLIKEAEGLLSSGRGDKLRIGLLRDSLARAKEGDFSDLQEFVDAFKEKADAQTKRLEKESAQRQEAVDRNAQAQLDKLGVEGINKRLKSLRLEQDKQRQVEVDAFSKRQSGRVGSSQAKLEGLAREEETLLRALELASPTKKGSPSRFASSDLTAENIEAKTAFAELKPIESIEMVRISKDLMGKFPKIKKLPKSFGLFHPSEKGAITINTNLFKRGQEKQLASTLAHEIGHLVDYIPENDLRRGNMFGHLLSVKKHTKNIFGDKTVTNKDVREELKKLTQIWKPFNEETSSKAYIAYRNSSVELYADFVSVLFNNPGLAQETAPNAFNLFFEGLDKKPEAKSAFFAIQELVNGKPEDIVKARQSDIRRMFAKGEDLRQQMDAEKKLAKVNIFERIRQMLDDKNFPIIDKIRKSEAKGVLPKSELLFELQEKDLVDNDNYLMLADIDENVIKPIEANEMTIDDLGEFTFLSRVVGRTGEFTAEQLKEKSGEEGFQEFDDLELDQINELLSNNSDREDIANPLGFAPETAKKQLEFLKSEVGEERFKVLEESAQKFHDIVFKSIERAVEVGVYNTAVFEKVIEPNKNLYVSFGVLNYLQDSVPAGIKAQKGTLSEIENPIITTILKTISLNRLNARNKAVSTFVNEWSQQFPEEITASRVRRVGGKPAGFVTQKGKGQVGYLQDGRPAAYDVDPYIARSFENTSPAVFDMAAALNRMLLNKQFKNLVITYNLGFSLAFNPIRDFKRTFKNLNALGHKITVRQLMAEYMKNLPRTIQRQKGINDEGIKEMLANKALDIPFVDFNFDIREDSFGRTLKKFRLMGDTKKPNFVKDKMLGGVSRVLESIRFVGSVTENLSKISGYNFLKDKVEDDRQRAWITRNYIGTPNYRVKGELTDVTNQIFIFSNIMKEGLKSDLTLATNPTTRSGWWWANFKLDYLPKMLMFAAASGLAGGALKDWFEKVPEYDKANYVIIPLGTEENGRAVYARIPHDETTRLFAAILWKTMNAPQNKDVKSLTDIFAVGAGNIPGVAPAITNAANWTQYLSGKNPYDNFRGRYVIPDNVYRAGGFPALNKMVQWSFNNAGFSQFTTYDDRRDTTFEAILKGTPGLNAVTRVLKVSDYGLVEKNREINQEAQSESAARNLKRRELFDKELKNFRISDLDKVFEEAGDRNKNLQEKLDIVGEQLFGKEYDRKKAKKLRFDFMEHVLKEQNNPYVRGILSATANDIKVKILKQAKDSLSIQQYNAMVDKLKRAKSISQKVINEAAKK